MAKVSSCSVSSAGRRAAACGLVPAPGSGAHDPRQSRVVHAAPRSQILKNVSTGTTTKLSCDCPARALGLRHTTISNGIPSTSMDCPRASPLPKNLSLISWPQKPRSCGESSRYPKRSGLRRFIVDDHRHVGRRAVHFTFSERSLPLWMVALRSAEIPISEVRVHGRAGNRTLRGSIADCAAASRGISWAAFVMKDASRGSRWRHIGDVLRDHHVHAGDHRHHRDQRGSGQNDAQQREEAAQFAGAQRLDAPITASQNDASMSSAFRTLDAPYS